MTKKEIIEMKARIVRLEVLLCAAIDCLRQTEAWFHYADYKALEHDRLHVEYVYSEWCKESQESADGLYF